MSEPGSYDYGWEERKRLQRDADRLTAENAALRARVEELEHERDEARKGRDDQREGNKRLLARVELLELLASDVVDEFDGTIGPALVGAIKTLGAALSTKGGETEGCPECGGTDHDGRSHKP